MNPRFSKIIIITLALSGLMVACAPLAERASRLHLWDLYLRQPDGRIITYLDALAPITLPRSRLNLAFLPLANLSLHEIPDCIGWMRDYDRNGDGRVDIHEMTQAWLVRTPELKTGNRYGPDTLLAYPAIADLAPGTPIPAPIRSGVSLRIFEQAIVRIILEGTPQGRADLNEIEMIAIKKKESRSCDEDAGGGPRGHSGTPPGHGGTPPGQGGTPPGQGGTPPGQGGTPPGQGGTPPGQGGGDKPGKGPKK